MRGLRSLVALAVLLLAVGCTVTVRGKAAPSAAAPTSGSATSSQPPVDPLEPVPDHPAGEVSWYDCSDMIDPSGLSTDGRKISFECASYAVPADYAKTDGDKIELLLLKAHLEGAPDDRTPLLMNPGGPGVSGVNAAIGLAYDLPLELLEKMDLVGFDPRGVGESEPVQCLDDDQRDDIAATDPTPDDAAEEQALDDDMQALVDGCVADYPNLEHLNTVATARDMDQLREALGEEKLAYLGYSYGTELGSVYAMLFPEQVGRFVLDGAVDPTIDDLTDVEQQLAGFEAAFNRFVDDCAAQGASCPVSADPKGKALELIAASDASPIPNDNDDRLATEGIVRTAFGSALYDESWWPDLATAIADGLDGDATKLFELADAYNGRYDLGGGDVYWSNVLDANVAIACNDSLPDPAEPGEDAKLAEEWGAKYPVFGEYFAWGGGCDLWPTRRHPIPQITATDADPILVVGTTNDPATPYSGAVNLAATLGPTTGLLTYDGDGHTAFPATDCINDAVVGYLVDGVMPPAGTTCTA